MCCCSEVSNIEMLNGKELYRRYRYYEDYNLSWEELQTVLKYIYYHEGRYWGRGYVRKLECVVCGNIFYAKYPHTKYCTYRCSMDSYVEKRRQRTKSKYWSAVCQHCNSRFNTWRVDSKYCCDSHRVLACLNRKKKEKEKS